MKKNLLLVLAIVLVVAFSLVLTVACDKTEHTHDFGDAYTITVEPTETTKGKATHKCECGDIEEVEIPALTDSVWTKSTTDATCSAEGSSVYTSVYGKVTVTIGKLNHTEVIDAAVEATCTTAGKTEGKHCSVCNTVIVAQEDVPAKGHTEVIDAAVAATCTTAGKTEGKHCSVCNEVLVAQETVAALGHTEVVDAAVAPTCTETGLTEGKHCSVCNEVLVAQEVVDALGHTEETIPGKAPTCTETGLTDGVKCSVCGEILTAQEEIAATGHTEVVDAAVAPTCTETGLTEGKHCSVCGEVLVAQEVVDALGHNYDDVGHCDRCGLTDPTKCAHPTFAHTEAKAPTCTENGNIEYWTCEGCATIYSDEAHTVIVTAEDLVVPATGHTEVVDDAVAPSCTETGLTAGSHCSVCGEVIVAQEVVDALGHTEETIPGTPATCTEAGLTDGVECSVCGEIITAQEEIAALGHDIVANDCSRCDFGYTVEEVLEMTYALESGKSLKGTYKLTGIVTAINTAYSSQFKNVTVTIAVEGNEETKIQLYRLKGEGVDTLAVGDIVTAVGPIKNYNGTFEMDVPTVAETPDLVKVTYQQNALTLDVTETQVSFVLPAGNIASVEWSVKEANPALTVDGFNATVTPQAEDATVVLVATITSGSVTTNKEFIVVVPKLAATPADKVADVKESLTFTANTWYKNGTYTLPVVDTYDDVTVAWTVDCAYATIADGVLTVTIDELTEDITTVVTATITCEDVTDTATYDVAIYGTVLGRAYCLADGEYLGGSNSSKYTLTGVVSEIDTPYSSQYKNLSVVIIIDGNEEKPLLLFRLSGTGVENIKVGDTVTANGPIKNYKGTVEMDCPVKVLTDADHAQSEVDALTVPTEVDASFTLPTAAQGTTAWEVVTDTTAITVDGVNATVTRGAEDVVVTLRATVTVGEATATKDFDVKVIKEGGVAVPETTVNFVVADYAAANSWVNSEKYTSATVDSNVSISIVGEGNTGKYYTNGQNWRMYQADTPSVIISAAEGNTILSVKVSYTSQNTGSLTLNGANVASNTVVDVNAASITFGVGNTGSATNGQARITAIEIVYVTVGGGETPDVCEHANTTYHAVVEPTCTTDGCLDYYSCNECGKLFADEACTEEVTLEDLVVAGGHSYGELSVGFAATCTSEGMIDFYQCSVCHTYFDADKNALENEDALTIPVVPHSYGELVAAVEPTCDSEGLHAHYECSVCHKVFDVDKVETTEEDLFIPVDATKHTYGDLIPAQDPTCTEDGWYAYYECACGKLFDIDKVETTLEEIYREAAHTVVVDAAVAPTCTETGLTEGSHCSVCNEVFVAQEVVDALGHTPVVDAAVAPTCTETGLTEGSHCSVCGEVLVAQEDVDALGHTPVVDAAVAPTCTETGLTEGSHCSVCGEVLVAQEVVAATGHSHVFVDFVTQPTLDVAGVANFTCACGDATTEEVPALSDTETWTEGETVAPDYNNAGSTVYTSDVYGEVTVAVAKLVAPYDNKTYSPVAFEAVEEEEKNRVLTPVLSWNSFVATFGPDGKVTDPEETSFMFRGAAITMVDPLTGEISYATSSSTYKGFVDMTTGIIVKAHTGNALNYVNLLTPFEVEASAESFSASTWNDRMAIAYTYGENVYNIYVTDTRVYFGVSFTDLEGNAIAGNACYLADYLYVKDSAGNLIDSFGYTAEVGMEALDGYEGTYNGALGQVFLNGRGIINLVEAPSVVGTYTIVDDADYTAEVILGGKFLTVTIDGEGNYVAEEHNSDITFAVNNAEYTESVAPVTVALNIPYELPDLGTTATKVFLGWYIEDATQLITSLTPTEPAYILNAKWGDLCVVTLVGVPEGVETTHYLSVGTVVTDVLPELPEVEDKVFAGWFADEEYTIPVEGLAIEEGMTEVTIYARYDDLAPYVGTYYGVEIWNASYGNSSMKTMTIDANGNISGLKTGIIESYDPATQTVTWKTSAEATSVNKFYFDPETDVIAGIYNSTEIGNDFYFLSKNFTAENFKVTAHYGVKAPKEPGSSSIGWYAHFINDGTNNIFLYNNHIYANPTITDVAGNTLAVANVQNSKTVVVHHNDVMVIAIASQGDSFTANNNTDILEAPFGTFTCEGEEDLVLDGTGKFTWGENAGTYTANGEAYDLYTVVDGVNVAYHTVTLDGTTYTATKPYATINFVVGDGHDAVESVSLNYNILTTLPTPADTETHIFRGWYLDDPANAVYTFTATESEYTFTAKWDVKVSLTVVYGKGIDNAVLYYAVGETTAPVEPEYTDGQVFDHWYTSADEGVTETAVYTPGAITENTVIYCAWADPEPWFNTYYTVSMGWSASTSYATKALTVAPNGVGTFTSTSGSTPFYPNSTVTISYLDKEAGKVLFTEVYSYEEEDYWSDSVTTYSGTRYFWGIIDPETGIIVRCTNSASSVDALSDTFGFTFYVMIPETVVSANVKGGRFEEASTSTDHVVFSYTFADASVCTIYLTDTNAYFGASVESEDGTAIEDINNIDTAETIYVYDSEDNLIVCFANNGSDKFVALDGYQGTYTNDLGGDVVVDGHGGFVLVLGGNHVGTYTLAVDAEYTADAYIAEGEYAGYFEITLDKVNGTFDINKPTVTVSYNVGEVTPTEGAPADVSVNKNFAYTLPVLTSESHIFRGWFADAECTEAIGETYAPSATGTIYAKWDAKLTLTVVYGNGMDNAVLYYGAGDTTAPVAPAFTNGKEFDHWYTSDDEGVTETAVYTPGAITENTVIYCAWKDSLASAGAYMGFNLYGTGTDKTQTSFTTNVLTINADGTYNGRETGTLTEEQKLVVDGAVTLEGSYFYINTYANAVWTCYSKDQATVGTDTYFGIRGSVSKLECSRLKYNTSYFAAWVTVYYTDETTANIFLYNNRIYDNVTWTEGVTALKASAAAKVLTYDKHGDLIVACFAGTFKEMDAYVGDYANGENTLTLDGFGGLTITDSTLAFDGATGTYTVASDADYTLDATIDGTNYEITLVDGAYTIVKPVFAVHFDTDELVEVEDQTVNKGAKFTLPEVENPEGFKFAGWYKDAELTNKIYSAFAITEETTIYAKWEVSVTVTFDFLGGGDNVTLDTYYTNDTVASADIPAPTTFGDKVFVGWYTLNGTETDDWGTTFTSSTKLTSETTVYAKWILPVATMGSYKGFEIWGSTSTSTGKTFEVSATGVATGSKSGTITEYDAETGKFVLVNGSSRYNGHYDVATGTIAINYGTSTAGLGNDTWVFVKDATTVAIDKANSANWNNKYTRVATITVDEVDRVIFIYDGKVYGNVTVTALDGEGNAIADYASYATAASLTVANATDASVIANFKHDGADLVGLDGFEGTYVPSEGEATDVGTIVVDGVGTITAGENNYAYTVVDGSLVTVINNQTRVFFVLDGEYMFDQDGVQGEYDSVDGGDIYTFDGYGNWTALMAETSGTYVVNGASITLYETGAEEGVTYGLGDGALLGKTIFAGLTFTGTYYSEWDEYDTTLKVVFDDSPEISGVIYSGNGTSYYFNFTGVMEGDTLTLTITSAVDNSQVGKTVTFTVSNQTLTVASTTMTSNVYTFDNDGSATCESFTYGA